MGWQNRFANAHFVWWKCAVFVALGFGIGQAVKSLLPEFGPGAAAQMPVAQFVGLFENPALAEGQRVSAVTLYPPRREGELLIVEITGRNPMTAYLYAGRPFVNRKDYQSFEAQAAYTQANHVAYPRYFAPPTDTTRPLAMPIDEFETWHSAGEFLSAIQKHNPKLIVHYAWWAGANFQKWLLGAGGAALFGVSGTLRYGRRQPEIKQPPRVEPMGGDESVKNAPTIDPGRLAELEAAMIAGFAGHESTPTPIATAAVTPIPRQLNGQPLDAAMPDAKTEKEYAGEFYPTERREAPPSGKTE